MSGNTMGILSGYENVYFQHISVPNKERSFIYQKMMYANNSDGELTLFYESVDSQSVSGFVSMEYEMMKQTVTGMESMNVQTNGNEIYLNRNQNARVDNIISFVDYENPVNRQTDHIRYFSKTDDTDMYPISPESYYYTNKYAVFSLFGFDMLGWRHQTVVPFRKTSDIKFGYVTYDDIESVIRQVKHPLVKMKTGFYDVISEIETNTGYISMNTALMCGLDKHTQNLYFHVTPHKTIVCPYNVNGCIIEFRDEIHLDDYRMNVYKPESCQVAVMGILSVKDIDVNVNLERKETVTEKLSVELKTGDVLLIDNREDMRLRSNIVYEIEYGKFNEFSAYRFMISGNTLFYTQEGNDNEVYTKPMYTGALVVSSDMKLKTVDSNVYQTYSYTDTVPSQKIDNYFTDKLNKKSSKLKIPVVPLTNCLWESNGIYFDDNSVLDTDKLTKTPYEVCGQFNEHVYTPSVDSVSYGYVSNLPSSFTKVKDRLCIYEDVIRDSMVSNPIRKMIIGNRNMDTAIGYYNSYVQSLEFIYYGIKFTMKFNNEYHNQSIRIGEYNNFEIIILNEYDNTKENEIFISVDEEIILFVNHKFDINAGRKTSSQIKTVSGTLCGYGPYSYYEAPYSVYPDSIVSDMKEYISMCTTGITGTVTGDYYVQENARQSSYKDNEYVKPLFFAYDINESAVYNDVVNVKYIKDRINSFVILNCPASSEPEMTNFGNSALLYDNLDQINRNTKSFIIDIPNNDAVEEKTQEEKLDAYMDTFGSTYDCYIINNGNCETIRITESYRPLSITLSRPDRIKYNFGYFKPMTRDIIHFETNDYELSETLSMSMLLGNTKVSSIDKIRTYTGNKVFNESQSVLTENFFIIHDKSVFESNWDKKFYRSYQTEDKFSYLDGYYPGIEDKTFFGSRCMTVKNDSITLDDFSSNMQNRNKVMTLVNSDFNKFSTNNRQYKITINITQSLYTLFMDNPVFTGNWSDDFSDRNTSIKNYIASSISEIYNIQRKMDVVMYRKENNTLEQMQVELERPDDMDSGLWSVLENYETEFSTNNDELILTITMFEVKYSTVHPQIKIYRN